MRLLISALLAALLVSCVANAQPLRTQPTDHPGCTYYSSFSPVLVNNQTTRLRCDSSGNLLITGTVTATVDTTGLATSTNQGTQIELATTANTQLTAFNTAMGLQADAACATDNGACTLLALVKRTNQRLTTINTTLGAAPMQATGGTVGLVPSSAAGAANTYVSTTALAANQVVKASAGNLYSFQVSATATLSAAAWWIMIYDAASAPADGAVTPAKCYAIPSGAAGFTAAFPTPLRLATGITIGVSTTGCFTKTASTQAFISGDAQ